jgi:hypothetical protein
MLKNLLNIEFGDTFRKRIHVLLFDAIQTTIFIFLNSAIYTATTDDVS